MIKRRIPKRSANDLPKLLAKAQKIFNEYIRLRDQSAGCISAYCGGEVEHAGHYFNQGHHSKVRFDELNVNGCCVQCNFFEHGNLIRYRQGLVMKYGEDRVKILEAQAAGMKKWDRVELLALIQHYTQKVKELK
jgi:hypothetical protein